MIPGQALTVAELALSPVAVLAPIAVASEEECIGDLTAKAAGHMYEFDEADDGWFGQCESFASYDVAGVRFDNLGFSLDHQTEGTPQRHHRQRLKGGV
jgi:hypothetical protein